MEDPPLIGEERKEVVVMNAVDPGPNGRVVVWKEGQPINRSR